MAEMLTDNQATKSCFILTISLQLVILHTLQNRRTRKWHFYHSDAEKTQNRSSIVKLTIYYYLLIQLPTADVSSVSVCANRRLLAFSPT